MAAPFVLLLMMAVAVIMQIALECVIKRRLQSRLYVNSLSFKGNACKWHSEWIQLQVGTKADLGLRAGAFQTAANCKWFLKWFQLHVDFKVGKVSQATSKQFSNGSTGTYFPSGMALNFLDFFWNMQNVKKIHLEGHCGKC